MLLKSVHIKDFRAIRDLELPLDRSLTVLHGPNGQGKTSVLSAIALGLSPIPALLGASKAAAAGDEDIRTGADTATVEIQTVGELGWSVFLHRARRTRNASGDGEAPPRQQAALRAGMLALARDIDAGSEVTSPIIAYYDTERAVLWIPERKRDFAAAFGRLDAYTVALDIKEGFKELFEWFDAKEGDELREKRDLDNPNHRLPELDAVRQAIEGMLPGVRDPHIETNPLRFVVRVDLPDGTSKRLTLKQLSDGYRAMLALACDLARRTALANPHLPNPLHAEAIVLIDEIELHLHPSWQQKVLANLRDTFPNTQFIVSTHSPQVLTTVGPEHIVGLVFEDDNVVAFRETAPTLGNEAGDVLFTVMDVDERPPSLPGLYAEKLRRYRDLIALDQGETQEAIALRKDTNMQ